MNLTSMSLVIFLLCLPQTLPFRPRLTFRHPSRAKGSLNAVENDSTSPYQIQFQSKISALNSFSSYDLLNLKKPSHARLFLGARAASTEPLVIKAFSALYEDMSVLRLGGNMMFSYLMTRGEESKTKTDLERTNLESQYHRTITKEEFLSTHSLFRAIDVNNDSVLSRAELSDAFSTTLLRFNTDVDTFLFSASPDPNSSSSTSLKSLEFEEFILALLEAVEESDGMVTMEDLIQINEGSVKGSGEEEEEIRVECNKSERFDMMLEQVRVWEEGGLTAEGRSGDILAGTYAGAKNPEIVQALKVAYTSYSALRLAGDLIFKLLKAVMSRKMKGGDKI
ncbi:hypothetical protein TL16_g04009 [Triparma laevis f. inornata]|uniref:EF-hand domain-containing protein n=2 Tax=Triparma laevis TaxID=1534972 RepID=A0A9W7FUB3_9STRA|nr:hypothetical protein TL16_g04009 [Triparma laevis f. inornata]GMI18083.1 hypothetical protein TrLO_g1207 [Triparma laevis f. longispina]